MNNLFAIKIKRSRANFNLKTGIWLLIFWTSIGALLTSWSSIILKMDGVYTNWLYLSLNFFSRAWIWMILSPIIYHFYGKIFYASYRNYLKIIGSIFFAMAISILHVFTSLNLDIQMRSWMGIIEINFWDMIYYESLLVNKYLFRSFFTCLLFIAILAFNDHFQFIKRFVFKGSTTESKRSASGQLVAPHSSSPITVDSNFKQQFLSEENEKLTVKSGGKIRFLELNNISNIISSGNYVFINFDREQIMVRKTLSSIHAQVPKQKFFRISRSVIVNKDFIKELEPWFHGEHVIRMKDGKEYKTGRAYRAQLRLLLGMNISK